MIRRNSIKVNKVFFKEYPFTKDEDFKLVVIKGICPEYFWYIEWKMLPDIRCFYSSLNDGTVAEYKHAQNTWETFRIKNVGQYHDLFKDWFNVAVRCI